MTQALQLEMALSSSHRNHYLFSDHYLDNILPTDPRWQQALSDAQDVLAWLQDLYAREQDQLSSYNESQLEQNWFRPILERLGHVFEVQASVPGLDRYAKRPDYVFFPDESARQAAAGLQNEEAYAERALAVGEVKRWNTPLGKKRKGGSPAFEDQNPSWQIDYYLRITGLKWGVLTNGRLWRLVHEDTSHRLQIYYEIDLIQLLREADPDRMRYFTLFFRQAAFRPDAQGRVFLADVLVASNAYAVALEEDLRGNVYQALELLMQGFLDLSRNRLGPADLRDIYDNSLYLLYRLLFILYGESRGLLPMANDAYRKHYSLESIKREIALGRAPTASATTVVWGRLKNLFHIISGVDPNLNRQLEVPRYDGGLFDPHKHTFLEENEVGDRALVAAIDLLTRRTTGRGREFADYRTLSVRHLGSIYEGLLEYQPRIAEQPMVAVGDEWIAAGDTPASAKIVDRRAEGRIYLETDRGERKATGSYYTPQYIVEYIVEQTLGPLVETAQEQVKARASAAATPAARASAEQSLVDEILGLKVLDPAMGSGHFLVEATDFLALALATDPYIETETPEEDLVHWKRQVVERSIYGVDKNPLAVELAKLSLWLATVAADRPLSFLDHHLKCGDSLIGAKVEDLGWAPPPVLSRKAKRQVEQQKAGQMNMYEYLLSQKLPTVMGRILEITRGESRDYETVQAKEAADRAVQELKAPFEAVADLWTSAYFGHEFTPAEYGQALDVVGRPQALQELDVVERAQRMAGERRFFHWELAFPEVFFDKHGQRLGERAGFDAVIGNPPYVGYLRLEDPEREMHRALFDSARGKYDVYVLFIESSLRITRRNGMIGFIIQNRWLVTDYGKGLVSFLAKNLALRHFIDYADASVFDDTTNYPLIIIGQHKSPTEQANCRFVSVRYGSLANAKSDVLESVILSPGSVPGTEEEKVSESILDVQQVSARSRIAGNLLALLTDRFPDRLSSAIVNISNGVKTGAKEIYVLSAKEVEKLGLEAALCRPVIDGGDIQRFALTAENDQRIIFPYKEVAGSLVTTDINNYPNCRDYLSKYRAKLAERLFYGRTVEESGKQWYELTYVGAGMLEPKLVCPDISISNRFIVDTKGAIVCLNTCYILNPATASPSKLQFLCALLNSKLFDHLFAQLSPLMRGGFRRYQRDYLLKLPYRRIEFTTPSEKREALVIEARSRAEAAVQALAVSGAVGSDTPMDQIILAQAAAPVLSFIETRLEAQPEQADVVHDLLAHLAGRMIAMHEEKQERVEAFWLDLQGVTDGSTFETLRNHGKWESSLWKEQACRPFVDEESRSTRHLDESLGWNEECFKAFVKLLAGSVSGLSKIVGVYRAHHAPYRELVQRIEATDHLIDYVVYQLYGLTEEEIAIVEASS